ncbi:reticulon-4 isoform X2 [Arapaima gigas]
MEDNVDISSTTPHVGEPDFLEGRTTEPSSDFGATRFDDREALSKFDEDILDLAGGAKEAIARHRQSDTPMTHDFSAFGSTGPVEVPQDPLPTAGPGFGDSLGGRTPFEGFGGMPSEPETSPVCPADTGKEPRSASPPPPPNEPIFPPPAPSQPLMHSSAGKAEPLGQEGDPSRLGSVVFPSSISPLHSPDSLEELSLSESPNQVPMSMPFGSYAAPVTEFSQKPSQDVPLNEDMNMFECKTESEVSLGSLDRTVISKQDGETLKADTLSTVEGDRLLSSFMASEIDLGAKVDTGKSARCEDSGVASSPDEKLGSSVGSHDDAKTDSDKEGFDKDSESGESTGSTPTQSPVNPPKITAESPLTCAPFNPTANMDVPLYDSQDVTKAVDESAKGAVSSKTSLYDSGPVTSKVEAEDDDFMFEMKASKNPFQGFSPIGDSNSGFPQFGEAASDRKGAKVSESPTPDLVQHAHDGDLQDVVQTKPKEEATVDLVQMASDSAMETVSASVHSALPEESEESPVPPSLPDILKSSPLNPDKIDSGSSEESSDYEHSPTQEVRVENLSATNPFAFDTKISLLKEMVEETEARSEQSKDIEESSAEKTFGAFDLLKEAENTTKNKDSELEEKDWMLTGQDSAKVLEPSEIRSPPTSMNLPAVPPSKPTTAEESDSESPVTDSLSPVLEAMAKNPASFQVEVESKCLEDAKTSPVKVIKGLSEGGMYLEEHEVSEQEVSSEEFEFIERPPKGAMDEFLETLDSSRFAKAPEIATDDDASPGFGQAELPADMGLELGSHQNSYTLLTQQAVGSSPPQLKMDLEHPAPLSTEVVQHVHEASAPSPSPLMQSNTEELEKATPSQKKEEDQGANVTTHPAGLKAAHLPSLSTETVVDLLYWRDVKTTGVVFGASLFLLLSLTVCSIVSVCSYVALALLSVTITFRIYKGILQAVQKSDEGHPFKLYLDQELALSEDLVHKYSDTALVHINNTLKELRRLFLVEDLVDSLKFAVLMWILTYVGALFNGLTLLILGLIVVFSCPVIYERHQKQIDHYLALARNQMKDIVGKIQARIPGMKPKTE